ncbi:MAG: hypothetical protein VX681_02470, partial [Myxococcota bacterium]|nr:hypothetical protein [Myxococcota bacterium]
MRPEKLRCYPPGRPWRKTLMRKRSNVLLRSLLLVVPLVSNPGAALADAADDIPAAEYAGGTEDGEPEAASKSERMDALSDVSWGDVPPRSWPEGSPLDVAASSLQGLVLWIVLLPDELLGIDRSPVTLNRMGDLVVLRPLTVGFAALGAVTYGIAAGPTLIVNPDAEKKLREQLLYDPYRFIRDRPLGEPMPDTEGSVAAPVDAHVMPLTGGRIGTGSSRSPLANPDDELRAQRLYHPWRFIDEVPPSETIPAGVLGVAPAPADAEEAPAPADVEEAPAPADVEEAPAPADVE